MAYGFLRAFQTEFFSHLKIYHKKLILMTERTQDMLSSYNSKVRNVSINTNRIWFWIWQMPAYYQFMDFDG